MDRTLDHPARGARIDLSTWALALPREAALALLGIATVAVHLIDDAFLQPEAGTSARDHLVSGGVPLLLLALLTVSYPRLRGSLRAALTLTLGLLAAGLGAAIPVLHTVTEGAAGDDYTGLVATLGGLLLIVVGAATLWRTRRTDERLRRRYTRRILTGVAALVVTVEFVLPLGFAYWTTHMARESVATVDLGAAHEDVTFTTSDGLTLAGVYVPSKNGAAVIAFPGRSAPEDHARMLVRHGYGVLLFDPRGEGTSEGDPNAFGWTGEKDLLGAIDFLKGRPDVDPERIGGLGLSVGGELLLQTAAHTDGLKAVVSEGAGFRSFRELWKIDGVEKWLLLPGMPLSAAAQTVFSNQVPPPYLGDLVGRIAPRPVFLIYATHGQGGEQLNPAYYEAAGEPKTIWEIADAGHMDGLAAHPEEYERRVIAFFDDALLGGG